jgi:serine/threonine-protein kinase HipA
LYYPDVTLPDDLADEFFLVKFPRQSSHSGRPLDSDLLILETEAAYYQIASRLGFDTICHSPWPLTGSKGEQFFFPVSAENAVSRPSLWLPRFDRRITPSAVDRIGVESLYSLVGSVEPGATIAHTEYLRCLVSAWAGHGQQAEVPELVAEYVRRDLLNVVLGNSDNHGRNTSVLRLNKRLQLAPVYDLAPMVLDESGITRTSRWSQANELGGEFNWRGICEEAAEIYASLDADVLWDSLVTLARELITLPRLAESYGVPQQVLGQRTGKLNLKGTEQRLKNWGLRP